MRWASARSVCAPGGRAGSGAAEARVRRPRGDGLGSQPGAGRRRRLRCAAGILARRAAVQQVGVEGAAGEGEAIQGDVEEPIIVLRNRQGLTLLCYLGTPFAAPPPAAGPPQAACWPRPAAARHNRKPPASRAAAWGWRSACMASASAKPRRAASCLPLLVAGIGQGGAQCHAPSGIATAVGVVHSSARRQPRPARYGPRSVAVRQDCRSLEAAFFQSACSTRISAQPHRFQPLASPRPGRAD